MFYILKLSHIRDLKEQAFTLFKLIVHYKQA